MSVTRETEKFSEQQNAGQGGYEAALKLGIFPKEFERHFFDYADRRFLSILATSLLMHLAVILSFMLSPPSRDITQHEIARIQKQFANLILDKPAVKKKPPLVAERPKTTKRAERETEQPASKGTTKTARKRTRIVKKASSAEARKQVRTAMGEQRRRTRAQIKEEVANQGILGLLTSTGSAAQGKEVEDVLGEGLPTDNLDKALKGVTGLRRAAEGEGGRGRKGGRNVRSSRETGSSGIDELVSGLGKSASSGVTRGGKLEVGSTNSLLEDDEEIIQGARDPDAVSAIVQAHNSAIQYCYQRELKRNPSLRGKVVIRITISVRGSVTDAKILSSTLKNSRVERCILSRIRRWNDFGAIDPSKGDTTIRYVYSFGY